MISKPTDRRLLEVLFRWKMSKRANILWSCTVRALLQHIWLERNQMIIEEKSSSFEFVLEVYSLLLLIGGIVTGNSFVITTSQQSLTIEKHSFNLFSARSPSPQVPTLFHPLFLLLIQCLFLVSHLKSYFSSSAHVSSPKSKKQNAIYKEQ